MSKTNGNGKTYAKGDYTKADKSGKMITYTTLSFGDANDKWPFSFGKSKAKKLLATIEEVGLKGFEGLLVELSKAEN